ncbi:MAG: cell wall-active antibiotics response protein [Dysgonamonadaceae bacterium]|jgi:predicted membrane protein|nr:cell wall-active antibiotics response protein [Dysgonamonadaceae bacterium]
MKKITLGIIILFAGVFLLFHNLGCFPRSIYHIVISWQALLIGIGVVLLFDKRPGNKNAGIILTAAGTLFLSARIFNIDGSKFFLPLIIILTGILFIVKSATKKTRRFIPCGENNRKNSTGDGNIGREYIFTGSKEKWTYREVKTIEISAVFSSVELDFTQLELSREVSVQVKISAVFGSVAVYVPGDWNIIMQKTGVFGSFADNRPRKATEAAGDKTVYMEVEAVFGGGEIKCFG